MSNLLFHQRLISIFVPLFFATSLFTSHLAKAQVDTVKNKSPFPVKYSSIADEKILLKTITLAPVYDNTNGIYSKPIQKLLVDLLQSDKSWGFAEIKGHDENKFIENYDINQNDVLDVLNKTEAQGLITAFITKGPRGINVKLKLFTHDEGFILFEESLEDLNAFEISRLREQVILMYQNLKNKLPYRGYVLSRRGLDVTVSLGKINGVKVGQELTLAQIIKLNRHPKLKILVGVEKEIIAKVVVTKADDYLSFAKITFEKETGVVDVGTKVLPTEFVTYPRPVLNKEGTVVGDAIFGGKNNTLEPISKEPDNIAKNPTAVYDEEQEPTATEEYRTELFDRHNSLGVLTAQGSIAQFKETNNLQSGVNPTASQGFAPGIFVGAQIYVIKNTFVEANWQTHNFSVSNSLSGSVPFSLSYNYTKTSFALGYDLMFEEEENIDGIQFTGTVGFTNFSTDVDNSSPPAFTSTKTSGLNLSARALMNVSNEMPLKIGGRFDLYLSPSFSENPVNSGSASVNLTSFGFFGIYQLNDKYNLRGDLTLTNINTRFSGTGNRPNPAGSGSQEIMTQQFGLEYLF
jgi:hypothetical protein